MKIPFLMYHNICPEGNIYSVTRSNFYEQMRYLSHNNFKTISLDEFLALKNQNANIAENYVIITFDDGFMDNFSTALPILLEFGLRATFFITTVYIDKKKNFLTSEHIYKLHKSGMGIGSHTKSHSFLTKLDHSQLKLELHESKKILEQIIDDEIEHLSLPGGRYNKSVINLAKKIGYRTICNSDIELNDFESDPYELGRIPIRKNTSLVQFKNTVSQNSRTISKLKYKEHFKKMILSVLGDKLYDKIWHFKHNYQKRPEE